MKRKPVEDIIHELKQEVATNFFKANPIKRFPDDFLTKEMHPSSPKASTRQGKQGRNLRFEKRPPPAGTNPLNKKGSPPERAFRIPASLADTLGFG